MATINIVITDAGLAEIVNAEQTGTAPVVLTEVGLGTGQYEALPSQTALTGEFKRVQAVAGGALGDNALHLSVHDDSDSVYTVFELGVYTANGTLFAVYSQPVPIIQKAAPAHMLLALDMVLTNVDPDSVTVGDTVISSVLGSSPQDANENKVRLTIRSATKTNHIRFFTNMVISFMIGYCLSRKGVGGSLILRALRRNQYPRREWSQCTRAGCSHRSPLRGPFCKRQQI